MIRLLLGLFSLKYLISRAIVLASIALAFSACSVNAQTLLTGATKVVVGDYHSCALMSTGAVKCWGNGENGQLGNGSLSYRLIAVAVTGISNAVDIAAGRAHTCALTRDGGIKCWGSNLSYGTLGNNSTENSPVPVDVFGLETGITAIAAGGNFTCALANTGRVKCWGANYYGTLGNGTTAATLIPTDVVGLNTGIVAITAGEFHACALSNQGAVQCWGQARSGQLGNGNSWPEILSTPVNAVGLNSGVLKIDAGIEHTCALTAVGEVKCWGSNNFGQLGDNTTTAKLAPVTVSVVNTTFTALELGERNSCILTDAGGVKCWGDTLSSGPETRLIDVTGLQTGVAHFATRRQHSCAVLTNGGQVVCFGIGYRGVLGNNQTNPSSVPVNVIQATVPEAPTAVTATPYNSTAIVSFTPPLNMNNEPITGYTVISEPFAPLQDYSGTAATTRQIRGLINGVNYTFRVVATNIAGESQPSEPSNPIVPMSNIVPLPTSCRLTSELLEGVTFSSVLDSGDCPTSAHMREYFSFNAAPGDQVAFNVQSEFGIYIEIYDPVRMTVSSNNVYGGRYPSQGYITIPNGLSGAYGVLVNNASLLSPGGPYSITLLRNSSATNSSAQMSSSNSSLSNPISSATFSSSVSSANSISSVDASISSASSSTASSTNSTASSYVPSSMSSSQRSSSISSANSSAVTSGCGSIGAITFGTNSTGSLSTLDCVNGARGGSYYVDRYSFAATPGQQITIHLSSADFDSYLYLKNPSGTVVALDDDSGGGRNARIPGSGVYTIPQGVTGNYVIEVTSYSSYQTGAYSLLLLNSSSSSAASSVTSSVNNSSAANNCNTSTASVLNVTNSGSLTTTDCNGGARGAGYYTDRYTFTANSGQSVSIQLSATAFDTYLYLRNSSGSIVASNDDGGGGTNSRIPASSGLFTIPATGTYVIEVTSYSSGRTGAYTLLRSQ